MHHLEVRNLAAAYGALSVLKGVNLTLSKGEVVALIGPSGSGKSTVLRVLMGLTHPTGGEVLIDGAPIDYGRPRSVRASTATFASSTLPERISFPMTTMPAVRFMPSDRLRPRWRPCGNRCGRA